MGNAVFPALPGLAWGVRKAPIWRTEVQESVSGQELRWSSMTYPRYRITLAYEFLRAGGGYAELQTLIGFFNARRGSWESFLWLDPDDNTVADQAIGTGTGAQATFAVYRSLGGFGEPVLSFVSPPVVKVAGVTKAAGADYSIASGLLTFAVAPAAGATITWSGQFYKRVRFERDETEFEQFLRDLWSAKTVTLKTVKGDS